MGITLTVIVCAPSAPGVLTEEARFELGKDYVLMGWLADQDWAKPGFPKEFPWDEQIDGKFLEMEFGNNRHHFKLEDVVGAPEECDWEKGFALFWNAMLAYCRYLESNGVQGLTLLTCEN